MWTRLARKTTVMISCWKRKHPLELIQLMKLISATDNISNMMKAFMKLLSDWTMYEEGLLTADFLQTMPSMTYTAKGGNSYKSKSCVSPDDMIIRLEDNMSRFMKTLTSFLIYVYARNRYVSTEIRAAKDTGRKYLKDPESEVFMTVPQHLEYLNFNYHLLKSSRWVWAISSNACEKVSRAWKTGRYVGQEVRIALGTLAQPSFPAIERIGPWLTQWLTHWLRKLKKLTWS